MAKKEQLPEPDSSQPNRSTPIYLTGSLWSMAVMAIAAGVVLLFLNRLTELPPRWGFRGFQLYNALPLVTVAALISWRRPRNPIGWLLLVSGFVGAILGLLEEYATYSLLTSPGLLAGGAVAAWFSNWLWVPSMGLLAIHSLLLFPDGHFLSPKWRAVAWLGLLWILGGSLFLAVLPGPLLNLSFANNPLALRALPLTSFIGSDPATWQVTDWIWLVLGFGLVPMGLAVISLILRFRRARGRLRQQIKWIAFAAVFIPLTGILGQFQGLLTDLLTALGVTFLYMAMAFAILRYRLYDVDVIVRRTLTYGLLTGILALVYYGVVVLLQTLLTGVTGISSQAVIVVSTLVIAALFNPLRLRIQAFIDRRFYRRQYSSRRTLANFAAKARDEVELEALMVELLNVVQKTMQPSHASIWLQEPEE